VTSTPGDLLGALHADLARWAESRRGRVLVAKDLEHAVTLLGDTPSGWTGVLHWQGDDPAGTGTRRGNVVENNLRIYVRANLGPSAAPDIALIRPTAARPNPFLNLLAEVRTQMLRYRFAGVQPPGDRMSYKGTSDQAAVGGYLVAVYSMLFGIWSCIEMPGADDMIELPMGSH
jgi:hypothetical protein